MTSKEKLISALLEAKASEGIIDNAKRGLYSDFESPLATPCAQLVRDLELLGLAGLGKRARAGEFDATQEEIDAWMAGEGTHLVDEMTHQRMMRTGPRPEGAKDANTRDQMQRIAAAVNELVPDGWGFFVMAFPFSDGTGRMNYAGNAKRTDVLKLMAEFIEKNKHLPAEARPGRTSMTIHWVIYDRPSDYPSHFVVRKHYILPGPARETVAAARCELCGSLAEARAVIPPGLINLGRFNQDDPAIAEVWI